MDMFKRLKRQLQEESAFQHLSRQLRSGDVSLEWKLIHSLPLTPTSWIAMEYATPTLRTEHHNVYVIARSSIQEESPLQEHHYTGKKHERPSSIITHSQSISYYLFSIDTSSYWETVYAHHGEAPITNEIFTSIIDSRINMNKQKTKEIKSYVKKYNTITDYFDSISSL